MKIEFVKETKADGDILYFTKVDGMFADKSLSFKYDVAKLIYDNIVKNNGKYTNTEILESIEIKTVSI
jgi:hypothetical protein